MKCYKYFSLKKKLNKSAHLNGTRNKFAQFASEQPNIAWLEETTPYVIAQQVVFGLV